MTRSRHAGHVQATLPLCKFSSSRRSPSEGSQHNANVGVNCKQEAAARTGQLADFIQRNGPKVGYEGAFIDAVDDAIVRIHHAGPLTLVNPGSSILPVQIYF